VEAVDLFEILARSTWRTLARAHRRRILFGEDAITSINLNTLASLPKTVVAEDTRVHEVTKGCDFELWIGSDSYGWFRYAIQAKKLRVSSSTYAKLAYAVGGRKQIDLLEQYANANRAAALYCFYNYSQRAHGWACGLSPDPEQLGCSVTPLRVVRSSLIGRGRRNFSWIHNQPETLPWRCLVRCPRLMPGYNMPAHNGWPPPTEYVHKMLPHALRRLRELRTIETLDEDSDLFSPQGGLRPGWVGIIEMNDDRRNKG